MMSARMCGPFRQSGFSAERWFAVQGESTQESGSSQES